MFSTYFSPISLQLSFVRSAKIQIRFTSYAPPSIEGPIRTVRMYWGLTSAVGSFLAAVSLSFLTLILEGKRQLKDGLEFHQTEESKRERN